MSQFLNHILSIFYSESDANNVVCRETLEGLLKKG